MDVINGAIHLLAPAFRLGNVADLLEWKAILDGRLASSGRTGRAVSNTGFRNSQFAEFSQRRGHLARLFFDHGAKFCRQATCQQEEFVFIAGQDFRQPADQLVGRRHLADLHPRQIRGIHRCPVGKGA